MSCIGCRRKTRRFTDHSKWGFQQRNFNGVRGKTRRMALQHPMKCRIINSTMFCSQLPSFQKPQEDVLEGGLLVPFFRLQQCGYRGHPVGCRKDHTHLGRYPSLQEDDGRICGTGAGCLGPQLGQISNVWKGAGGISIPVGSQGATRSFPNHMIETSSWKYDCPP